MFIAAKLDRVVTYQEGVLTRNTHDLNLYNMILQDHVTN